jgi:hypothetical protein
MQKVTRFLKSASCLLTVVAAGGCLSATFVPTRGPYPARANACEIDVFSSAVPDREYEEIGIVEGEGSWGKSDLENLLPKLKEEACMAGGDGIIMQSTSTFAEGELGIRVQRISATVIRWKTE